MDDVGDQNLLRPGGPDNSFTLQKLEVFCSVVEYGGIGRAADELFVSQPVVSAHIRSLEKRIHAKLFEKDGRGIRLTEHGQRVHQWALDVLRSRTELDKALASLSSGLSGRAYVGASMSAGNSLVTPAVISFRERHPDAAITVVNSAVENALEGTLSGRMDFCVVATDHLLDSRYFESALIGQPPFALIAAASNSTIPDTATARDLAEASFVTPPSGLAIRRSQDAALAGLGLRNRRVVVELGSAEAIKQAVISDLGIALLWRVSAQHELDTGVLREVELAGPQIRDKLYMVHRVGKTFSPMQQRIREEIIDYTRKALGPDGDPDLP